MEAQLIATSLPSFEKLMAWTFGALGYSISAKADEQKVKGIEKYSLCLKELGADPFQHIFLTFQIICPNEDALDILQFAAMPFVARTTVRREIMYLLVSGTVQQWWEAVEHGLKDMATRDLYISIRGQIQAAGLDPWKPTTQRIEHKH